MRLCIPLSMHYRVDRARDKSGPQEQTNHVEKLAYTMANVLYSFSGHRQDLELERWASR